ncbi:hypothetical protein ACFVIN_03005 [Streptomyces prasinus]|uniref:hypothetical protein n=2 Tax=Streptomyces prasinus TaxID=67345 RepID=UPI00114688FB|nr:hypothetical protein [Streptomyces prasinus]
MSTVRLGHEGDFAVTGPRHAHGCLFEDFPRLGRGDAVALPEPAGRTSRLTHRIDRCPYRTVPVDIEVIGPVSRTSGWTRPGRCPAPATRGPERGTVTGLIDRARPAFTQPAEAGKPEASRR